MNSNQKTLIETAGGVSHDGLWLLREADLRRANLSTADLSEANLSEADLRWVKLSGADLSEADLRGADLRWANLSEAKLSEANLSGANLRGAIGIAQVGPEAIELLLNFCRIVAADHSKLEMDTVDSACGTAHSQTNPGLERRSEHCLPNPRVY
jgi:uncharacterized protein YjbI with pentapeptide repeats